MSRRLDCTNTCIYSHSRVFGVDASVMLPKLILDIRALQREGTGSGALEKKIKLCGSSLVCNGMKSWFKDNARCLLVNTELQMVHMSQWGASCETST